MNNDNNPSSQTATPTWLPPTPGPIGKPPDPATTWPEVPQDHGSASMSNGWNPGQPPPASVDPMMGQPVEPLAATAMPQPPVASLQTQAAQIPLTSPAVQPAPATWPSLPEPQGEPSPPLPAAAAVSSSFIPAPTPQPNMPMPPTAPEAAMSVPLVAAQAPAVIPVPDPILSDNIIPAPAPIAGLAPAPISPAPWANIAAPAVEPPALGGAAPVWPSPPGVSSTSVETAMQPPPPIVAPPTPVFPSQFTEPTPVSTPPVSESFTNGSASFDPLAAASSPNPVPTTTWPTPPSGPTPFDSFSNTAVPVSGVEPQTQPAALSQNPPDGPAQTMFSPDTTLEARMPDAPGAPVAQAPVGFGQADQSTLPAGLSSSFDTSPAPAEAAATDLSGLGTPTTFTPTFTPGLTAENPTFPVAPGVIPETMVNISKPRLSRILIIIGIVAILLLAGSASYLFFFSSGRTGTPEDTISLPIQAPLTKPKVIATPEASVDAASITPAASADSTSSGSAFDLLKKAKASPSPSPK